ncbi:MAG: OmpW family protein [Proteobacteria bacterium]|nr:OmpW family protein [Pseudomonadota bacterium]
MSNKIIAAAMIAAGLIAAPVAQADDTGLMVRARGVYVTFDNSQNEGLGATARALGGNEIAANDRLIPEVDFSWFFTKNIAAELVLTYPQSVNVQLDNTYIGKIKALPPSLVLQYHFTDFGAFKPYAGLGVNYTLFSSRDNIYAGPTQVTVESSSVGMVAQIGFDYMFTKSLGLNFDVKYIQMETDVLVKASGAKLGALGLSPFTTGLGLTYKF